MVDFHALQSAVELLSGSLSPWLVIVPGLMLGLIAGAIPGVSGSMAMAMVLPMSLYMDFLPAVMLLTSIFTGAGFGGAVPAILMRIPGTPSSVATTFDGYAMTEQGRHNEALGLGLTASCVGDMVSWAILLLMAVPIALMVLKFGPLELLIIALWGLTLIAALTGKSMTRGLLAGIIGVLLGTVGMTDSGYVRGTLGIPLLLDGVPVVPALMGLFVASQLFDAVGTEYIVRDAAKRTISLKRILGGMRETFSYPGCLIRGSLLGVLIGVIPGVGASVANLVSYSDARRSDDRPDTFGKGNPKGVVASESADNSAEGGSMATLLALGIPGGNATALLLSAFAMHNIIPGPRFISEQRDLVYAIILGNLAQAAMLVVVGIPFVYAATRIVRVPMRFLIPSVMSVAIFGSYALTGNASGPVAMFAFAVFGWLLSRFQFPVVATVIGLMLGDTVESELIRSYQISGGELTYLFERPIAVVFFILLLASLATPLLRRARRKSVLSYGES